MSSSPGTFSVRVSVRRSSSRMGLSASLPLLTGEGEPFLRVLNGEGDLHGEDRGDGDTRCLWRVELDEPLFRRAFRLYSGNAADGVGQPRGAVVGGVEQGGVGFRDFLDAGTGEALAEDWFQSQHELGVAHEAVREGGEQLAQFGTVADFCSGPAGTRIHGRQILLDLTGGVFDAARFPGQFSFPRVASGEDEFEEFFHGFPGLGEAHPGVIPVCLPSENIPFVLLPLFFVFLLVVQGFQRGHGLHLGLGLSVQHLTVAGEGAVGCRLQTARWGFLPGSFLG